MHERIHKKAQASQEHDSQGSLRRRQETEDPSQIRVRSLLKLQRQYGNRFVQRVMAQPPIRTKLEVSRPGDVHEQEADRVAEAVMRMPAPALAEGTSVSGRSQKPRIHRFCSECEDKLGRKSMDAEEDDMLRTKEIFGRTPEVTPNLEAGIDALQGAGQPLPESSRAFFEPRFGADFSQVRVHTDSRAAGLARAVNARAFTVGQDVAFGAGQYSPTTTEGKKLLAHELTHTIQQNERFISNDLIEDAFPRQQVIHRAVTVDDCNTTQETVIRDSHARAMEMVQNAIDKLGRYDGTDPPEVYSALNTHFHGTGTFLAGWIRANYRLLKGMSGSPQYECESVQVGTRRGWSMWCVPFSDIELYPDWFADSDIDMRARTMIHEWVHRYGCNFDLGYFGSEGYGGHSTARSLLNADPWAWFCVDVR
jgi:hypothetical protein